MQDLVTPKQVARAIGVSESSLKRWCDSGLIPSVRTAGGHRRIPISGVISYLRDTHQTLVAPEVLGLPATSGETVRVITRGREQLGQALLSGEEERSRQVVFDLYLSGQRISTICDDAISAAFTDIGNKWACQEADVYEERRACEIAVRVLLDLRRTIPNGVSARTALGGTIEGDQYILPTTMVELILRDNGWNARSLGTGIPISSLATSIRTHRPQLFWLSVSYLSDEPAFFRDLPELRTAASECNCLLVAGGFALTPELRPRLGDIPFCETMQALEALIAAPRP